MKAINRINGKPIIGTYEQLMGTAYVSSDSFTKNAEGGINFDYDGETDIWWDAQETVYENGVPLFVDVDHNIVSEKDIELVEE